MAEDGGVKLKVDERGNVDFREMHAVVNVREADFLVTVHEPTVAEPGVDVFGHPIPARQGQKTVISRGHGVKASEDGRQLFAEIEGHVGWKRRTLTVEPVYVVNGNVDFAVGNINFNGSVHVTKDVADGFVVQARDSVEVAGTVGGSKVIAGQSVLVRGGVAAKEQGYISAGDAVITKFLNNAAVDCGGDLTVDTQIVNSTINCAGCVRAPNARIVGGAVVALAGMELGEVGTPGGTRTQLRVTIEGFQNAEIREIDAQIAQLKEAAEKIRVRIAPLLEDPAKIKALNQQQREVVKTLAQKMNAGKKEIDALVAQRADLARAFAAKLKPEINVKRVLHPGVEILIDECRAILNEPVIGPVRLKPNYTTMGIAISS
ncbi:MAG: DUF342 domain-containing protein [Planctomycetes bacterium]|nr:DUF342 domain-containing protein [Planctomycetota bacterium]